MIIPATSFQLVPGENSKRSTALRDARRWVARRCAGRIAALVAVIAATGGTVAADGQTPKQSGAQGTVRATAQAIRIELRPKTVGYTVGSKPDLVLTLRDSKGAPVAAPKDFSVVVEALSPDGKVVHKETITVKKGQTFENFDLDIDKLTLTGAIRVRATNPELLEGGTVLFGQARPKPVPKHLQSSESAPVMRSIAFARWPPPGFEPLADVVPARLELEPPTGCGGSIVVSTGRTILADTQDAAELTLVVEGVEQDTSFYLQTTRGALAPNPIVIKAGPLPVGTTRLTSDSTGDATVSCVRAVPSVSAPETPPVTIRFRKPVTDFELIVTPPSIPWIDRAGIAIRLLRQQGDKKTTIATDEKMRFALSRDSGSGEIQPEVVDIDVGQIEGRATFLPYDQGPVLISAATSGFVRQQVELNVVALPYLMFLLPVIGGLCGGVVALVRPRTQDSGAAESDTPGRPPATDGDEGEGAGQPAGPQAPHLSTPADVERQSDHRTKPKRRSVRSADPRWNSLDGPLFRILAGILTGTVLHWALVFEVLPILPRQVVMSLISWFVLPLIGGWLGTEVFRVLLNQFGIGSKVPA